MFISTWWVGKNLQSSFKMWLCNPHACKWSCSIFLIHLQHAEHKSRSPLWEKSYNFLMTESFHPYSLLCTISGAHGTWGMGVAAAKARLTCLLSLSGISLMAIRTWLLRSLPAYTTPYVPFPSTTLSPFSSWSYSYYRKKVITSSWFYHFG